MKSNPKPANGAHVPDEAILAKLESLHAEAMKQGQRLSEEPGYLIGREDDKAQPHFSAASSIFQSLIAFRARSWPTFEKKARILSREYPGMSGAEILRETERGHGDVIASILDDLLALVRAASPSISPETIGPTTVKCL